MLGKTQRLFPVALAAAVILGAPAVVRAESASADGMTVEANLEEGCFVLEVSGIQHPEKDQLLTFTLMQEAGQDTAQLVYADAEYVNGREEISLSFPLKVSSLEECVLTVQNEAGGQKVVLDFSPEETKPEESSPEGTEPEESSPGETEPGETKPEETSPAESEAEETQPSETQPSGGTNPSAPTQDNGAGTSSGGMENPPKTGDDSRMGIYGAICLAAAAGAVLIGKHRRSVSREEKRDE